VLKLIYVCLLISTFLISCADVSDSNTSDVTSEDWLIPKHEVFDGGPGKDGIPALTNPAKDRAADIDYLEGSNLVLLYKSNAKVYIYPHKILDWHEIINDVVNDQRLVVSYCPLTGSAVGIKGEIELEGKDQNTTFGVSGLLYNSNLILYDRETDSYWSQMRTQCVAGRLIGQFPKTVNLIETTFQTARSMYPDAQVVTNITGVYSPDRYNRYPYGDYRTNDNRVIFPISNDDSRLGRKERVFAIINGEDYLAFRFDSFDSNDDVSIGTVNGFEASYVLAGNKSRNFIVAYERMFKGIVRNFKRVPGSLPIIMEDDQGNRYDIFGEILSGPDKGEMLTPVHSYISYWFAWGTFYPNIEIVENLQ